MFSLVRKVVAGPKITTLHEGQELDLTYITERVIAMAFPASDLLEKAYRNNIKDVSGYLQQHHHDNYLVINVSSRDYDPSAFRNQVNSYEWPDHQTPPFTTLVQVAHDMYSYLKKHPGSVVAVHCNHGKGRTGTAIIALLLLINFFKSAVDCLKFYNSKRFNKRTYGVDQPCQLRYLNYFQAIMDTSKINNKLVCYRLKGLTHRGLDEDHYLNISFTRNQELVYEKVRFSNHRLRENNKILLADVLIELYYENWSGRKKVARINYNLFFLNGQTKLRFAGDSIKVESGHTKEFEFTLHFEYYCLCHLAVYQESVCKCRLERMIEEKYWDDMIEQVGECRKLGRNAAIELLYNPRQRQPKRKGSNNGEGLRLVKSMGQKKFKNAHQEQIYAYYQNCSQKKQMREESVSEEPEDLRRSQSAFSDDSHENNEEEFSFEEGSPTKPTRFVESEQVQRRQGERSQEDLQEEERM